MFFVNFVLWIIVNSLVKPKIQQIRVKPEEFLDEGSSNFSIICNISANYSNKVEFLFRFDESKQFEPLENVSSVEESRFTWVATLNRRREKESNGEYLCRLYGDNNTSFKIAANIIKCMYYTSRFISLNLMYIVTAYQKYERLTRNNIQL